MLQRHAEDLWTADYELRLPVGIPFPTRMTVIRFTDGSLALISPVPIDHSLAEQLGALGSVRHLIAPNLLHHLHLRAARTRYPDARLVGPEGLSGKERDLTFEPLNAERSPFRATLAVQTIEGAPKISETVFFHRPSKTLIVTDLVFNIETAPSWSTSVMLWMTGTRGRLAQSRAWSFMLEDASRGRVSCERVFEWDFDRLIVAHGDVVSSGAKERLRAALTRTAPRREELANLTCSEAELRALFGDAGG